eukprot:gene26452-31969_t
MLLLRLLLLLPQLLSLFRGCLCSAPSLLTVVSIVDAASLLACMVKMHSIVIGSADARAVSFATLVVEDPSRNFTLQLVQSLLVPCFETRAGPLLFASWRAPSALANLSERGFDRSLVYARFYLPQVFPHLRRCVYMDNDVVVNMDVLEMLRAFPLSPMRAFDPALGGDGGAQGTGARLFSSLPASSAAQGRSPHSPQPQQGRVRAIAGIRTGHARSTRSADVVPAVAGFVLERAGFYVSYLQTHFNMSSALVQRALRHLPHDVFLNAGVFLLDADAWRQRNLTARAEQLLALQRRQQLFSSQHLGDQGLFTLLLLSSDDDDDDDDAPVLLSQLPVRFNMRRLPRRSLALLAADVTGAAHFAGMLPGGDALFLCRHPLHYPVLRAHALPLFLSAALALHREPACSALWDWPALGNRTHANCTRLGDGSPEDSWGALCQRGAVQLLAHLRGPWGEEVRFHPGRGALTWPPPLPPNYNY